jgi:hypothetical protein
VRKYAAEQGIAEEEALKKGMEAKSKEVAEKGSELYAKAQKPSRKILITAHSRFTFYGLS